MATKHVHVSEDIHLEVDGNGLSIISRWVDMGGIVIVDRKELPALLARLQEAAEAMGVATAENTRAAWLKSTVRLALEQLENDNPSAALDTLRRARTTAEQ